ncbi:MAG: hypothetical protein AAGD14_15575 [Planctomycetota bacterium]
MSILDNVLPLFLTRTIGGYAICLGLFGPRVTEGSWRRVSLFVIAGLCAAAAFWGAPLLPVLATGITALLLERGLTFRVPVLNRIEWMAPLGAWVLFANEWPPSLATVPAAIASGGALGAMLLGHSYLTARKLSFKVFQHFTLLLLVILVVRAVTVVPVLFDPSMVKMDWVYFSARVMFGLVLPLVFGWMAWQCAKIESNQSATGILYAMTALVFLGEMTAVYFWVTKEIAA